MRENLWTTPSLESNNVYPETGTFQRQNSFLSRLYSLISTFLPFIYVFSYLAKAFESVISMLIGVSASPLECNKLHTKLKLRWQYSFISWLYSVISSFMNVHICIFIFCKGFRKCSFISLSVSVLHL